MTSSKLHWNHPQSANTLRAKDLMFLATTERISQSPGTGKVLSLINLDVFPSEFSRLGDQSD